MEGSRLDIVAHVQVHIARVKCVQEDARAKDGGYEPAVGDGACGHVEAQSHGKEVEQEMQPSSIGRVVEILGANDEMVHVERVLSPLANLVAQPVLVVHHGECNEGHRGDRNQARQPRGALTQQAQVAL